MTPILRLRCERNTRYYAVSTATRFVTDPANFALFLGGIGSGKTLAGSVRAALATQGWLGKQKINTPNLGVVTAPTYPMLRDATIRTFFEIAGDLIAPSGYNKSEQTVLMKNGSEVIFRSTEHPERLRGPNAAWWFGDEAALYTVDVWKIMIGRLRQYGKRGHAWLTTTPKGRNWIWQKFEQSRRRGYSKVVAATWMNPFLDEDFVRSLMVEYAGDFALQELEGVFVAWEGLIYGEFSRDVHVRREIDQRRFTGYYAGVDWGFANPGVILVCGLDTDGRLTIVHEEYTPRRRVEDWVAVAKQLNETYHIRQFWCDPSEPDYIKMFNDANLSAVGANNTVTTGIQAVKSRLTIRGDGQPRLLLTPESVWTATQFEQYQWAKNQHGIKDAPLKANDHALDALRYLVMGVDSESGSGEITISTRRYAG